MAKYSLYGHRAEELYVRQSLSLTDIARILPVSEQTLSAWKKIHRWDAKKKEFIRTPMAAADRVEDILVDQLKDISTKIKTGELSAVKAADTIAKLVSSRQKVKREEEADILGSAPIVMHRFISYVMNREEHKHLAEPLAEVIPHFMDSLWERYRR